MTPRLRILATVLDPDRIGLTTLVFRSVRTGFPTADIEVWGNALPESCRAEVAGAALKAGARWVSQPERLSHDGWLEGLLESELEPFWICDTDVVFWSAVEDWFHEPTPTLLAGRFEPDFVEEWTDTLHVRRLHTSLLWLNAPRLREAMRTYRRRHLPPGFPFRPSLSFVRQCYVPRGDAAPLFYDTAAGLYHAVGGSVFTEEQNAAFDHLHCGTYARRVPARLPLAGLDVAHQQICEDPQQARGLRERQAAYYAQRQPTR